jgi:ornithine decarboxylase
VVEIQLALSAGATADRISFGNTIKKERDVLPRARARRSPVRGRLRGRGREVVAPLRRPGSTSATCRVFCRILCDCAGAEWPLSRKFGCAPEMAIDVLEHAYRLGLEAYGVSFHVGSQQRNTESWDVALASASAIFRECAERGIHLSMVNLGGGFPTKYLKDIPAVEAYGQSIFRALTKHFRQPHPGDHHRAGPRHGGQRRDHRVGGRSRLEEVEERGRGALGLSRHRQVRRPRRDDGRVDPLSDPDRARRGPHGPLRARRPDLRLGRRALREGALLAADFLEIGDKVLIEGTGAYTTTYAAVAFNGFPPLKSYVI